MLKTQKETYFTGETIEFKSLEIMKWLEPYSRNRNTKFYPEHSALLALDLQAYFLEESSHAYVPSSPAILPNINAMIKAYTDRGFPVFFSRHINTAENAGLMARWWHELIVEENPLSKIDWRIDHSGGVMIEKTRYDAFYETSLDERLKKLGVSQVVICGLMTHLCCETTARSAFMRGFAVYFCIDGTATYNETFHRCALLNLAHGFATPVRVKDILAALGEDHVP